jgi:hypothetical protein
MRLIPVSDVFDVIYGVNLELNALTRDPCGVNFVSRTARNNGVSARVKLVRGVIPLPAGCLTVAGGGSVLETFVQPEPFYSGRDLYVLIPKEDLSLQQKLFACMCIKANKYRYNYGRQANRTLRLLRIPDPQTMPSCLEQTFSDVVKAWGEVTIGVSRAEPTCPLEPDPAAR